MKRSIFKRAQFHVNIGLGIAQKLISNDPLYQYIDYKDASELKAISILNSAKSDKKAYQYLVNIGIDPECPRATAAAITKLS